MWFGQEVQEVRLRSCRITLAYPLGQRKADQDLPWLSQPIEYRVILDLRHKTSLSFFVLRDTLRLTT